MPQPNRTGVTVLLLALAFAIACTRRNVDQIGTAPAPPAVAVPEDLVVEIDLDPMLADLAHLASDALGGRDSRKPEIVEAARFIEQRYREAGVRPANDGRYVVEYDLPLGFAPAGAVHVWIEVEGQPEVAVDADDVHVFSTAWNRRPVLGGAAEGSTSRPERSKVAGRILILTPLTTDPKELRDLAHTSFVGGTPAVIFAWPENVEALAETAPDMEFEDLPGPVIAITRAALEQLVPLDSRPRHGAKVRPLPARISIAPRMQQTTQPRPNVLASIPGTDHADEIVVLGAHFDHIGAVDDGLMCRPPKQTTAKSAICNGADDNASGTVMLLAIARALEQARFRPRRTLVFAHFSGEEMGLLGSKALVAAFDSTAPFDRGQVVAMVNLDMVGRYREETGLTIGGRETSSGWPALFDALDPRGLRIVYDDPSFALSDHINFRDAGIPALFLFTGLHDDYHRTSDEYERVNTDAMKVIAQYVLDLTVALAVGAPVPRPPEPTSDPRATPEHVHH